MPSEAESAVAAFFHANRQKKYANSWQADRLGERMVAQVRWDEALARIERAAERDDWERGQE